MSKSVTKPSLILFTTVCLILLSLDALAMQEYDQDKASQQAQDFLNAEHYQAAYALLLPLETQYAGDMHFDMALGNAAVGSEHYTQAIFALERVLAIDPENNNARAQIAKAHFALGEIETSKSEFKSVLVQDPSVQTANAIEKYLSAIDKAIGIGNTYSAYIEAGLGWDNNVNSATSANTVSVPAFGGFNFAIAEGAKKKSDTFINLAGGAAFSIPVSPSVMYVGNLQFSKKLNQQHQEFETSAIDLNVGIQFKRDDDTYTLAAQDGHFYVDDNAFRHSYGVTAQWQKAIDAQNQTSLYGQYSKLEYQDNSIRDANRYVLGANYAHAFQYDTSPVAYIGAYIGQEDATKTGTQFLDQDIYGLRAGGQLTVAPRWLAYASAGYEARDYQADDLAFLRKRKDDQYDLTLGINYIPAPYWTIKPQINLIKNDSNIEVNAFDRASMSINIRRDFNW